MKCFIHELLGGAREEKGAAGRVAAKRRKSPGILRLASGFFEEEAQGEKGFRRRYSGKGNRNRSYRSLAAPIPRVVAEGWGKCTSSPADRGGRGEESRKGRMNVHAVSSDNSTIVSLSSKCLPAKGKRKYISLFLAVAQARHPSPSLHFLFYDELSNR